VQLKADGAIFALMKTLAKSFKGLFATAALALSAPALAQERDVVQTDQQTVEIYSISQTEGQNLARAARETLPRRLRKKYNTTRYNRALERVFRDMLQVRLIEKYDLTNKRAFQISKIYTDSYLHDWHYQTTPIDGVHTVISDYFNSYGVHDQSMNNVCLVGTADSAFPAQMWMSTFTHPSYLMQITPEQQTYTPDFERLAGLHERGHCFVGESEGKADYWAAATLLNQEHKNSDDLDRTVRFLEFFAALRYYNSEYNGLSANHATAEQAIYRAIRDYNNGIRFQLDRELERFVNADSFVIGDLQSREKDTLESTIRALLPEKAFDPTHLRSIREKNMSWMLNI
tara:strand:- start:620 stop:1651 length:1032 start_codon:yes stop_codon:yes gene_type:complete